MSHFKFPLITIIKIRLYVTNCLVMQSEHATFVTCNTANSVAAKLTLHIRTQLHQNSFEYYVTYCDGGEAHRAKKLEGSALKTCEWFVAVLGMGRYLFMDSK